MFSLAQRAQNISNYVLTLIITMSVMISLSFFAQLHFNNFQNLPGTLIINKSLNSLKFSKNFGGRSAVGRENIKLNFDLTADLTPLFNWNTKQVFVYLVAEYPGLKASDEVSKAVFWDAILTDKEQAVLDLSSVKSKYSVWDYHSGFENRTANMRLEYNIQPWVGPLIWGSIKNDVSFQFPEVKQSS